MFISITQLHKLDVNLRQTYIYVTVKVTIVSHMNITKTYASGSPLNSVVSCSLYSNLFQLIDPKKFLNY